MVVRVVVEPRLPWTSSWWTSLYPLFISDIGETQQVFETDFRGARTDLQENWETIASVGRSEQALIGHISAYLSPLRLRVGCGLLGYTVLEHEVVGLLPIVARVAKEECGRLRVFFLHSF